MTKEFENIVLKKLTSLEENVQNNVLKKIDNLENEAKRTNARLDNLEKDSVHEENTSSLNVKVFNHGIRISNLEDKVLTT